jgi:predicted AAA+ superfamily ATPase
LLLSERLSQSLAGRVATLDLLPLMHREIMAFPAAVSARALTLAGAVFGGGYPAIRARAVDTSTWLGSYVSTYVERDVRRVLNVGDLAAFQRFLGLCAGRTGQMLNAASLAADAGITQPTALAFCRHRVGVLSARPAFSAATAGSSSSWTTVRVVGRG